MTRSNMQTIILCEPYSRGKCHRARCQHDIGYSLARTEKFDSELVVSQRFRFQPLCPNTVSANLGIHCLRITIRENNFECPGPAALATTLYIGAQYES